MNDQAEVNSLAVPHSRESEEAVLGAVLINPEIYGQLAFLKADRFYIHRHGWIWEAIEALHSQRFDIDVLTVSNELKKHNRLEEIGGPSYITSLVNQTPSSYNAESYARTVHDFWIKRKTIQFANHVAEISYNGHTGDEVLSEVRMGLENIERGNGVFSGQTSKAVLSRMYDAMADGHAPVKFIPSGLRKLDMLIDGWHQKKLYYVSARPKQGKTSFLLQTAKLAAEKYKQKVGFFSLEMDEEEMMARMIQQETQIDSRRILRGELQEREWSIFTHALEKLSACNFDLHFVPSLTVSQLRSRAAAGQYDLIFVDYIGLMVSEKRTENRVQEVAYISRNLKVLAGELNVPVVAAAQLNRKVEDRQDKRPALSDLKDSGSLEQDADAVIFLYGKDEIKDDNPERKIEVAAQRSGPTGVQTVFFKGNQTLFSDEVIR